MKIFIVSNLITLKFSILDGVIFNAILTKIVHIWRKRRGRYDQEILLKESEVQGARAYSAAA